MFTRKAIFIVVISTMHTSDCIQKLLLVFLAVTFLWQTTNDAPQKNKWTIENIYKYIPRVLFVKRISISFL